jgi:hypothetical protein
MTGSSRRRFLSLSGAAAVAAALPRRAFATDGDWSADISVLDAAWSALHPGLLRYQTREQLDARLARLRTAWATPGSFRARLLALSRVTAAVRCGHTYPSPYNAGEPVRQQMFPDRSLVPFAFRWLEQRMVVTADRTGVGLFRAGDFVKTIDGRTTESLLLDLIPLARADGSNDAKRVSLMEMRGDDRFETFDLHLPLVLPLKDSAVFGLADGRRIEAPLLTLSERQAARPGAEATAADPNPWTLDKGEDGIVRLTMPGWALYDSSFDWRAWLAGVMDDLTGDGARGLIVDLRGNEGGLDCGDVILGRILERDLVVDAQQRWVRYRRVPDALRPHLSTWDDSFYDWGDHAQASSERPGFLRLTRWDEGVATSVIKAEGRRFGGKVSVLCDASNSSATFQFAQTVKDTGLATLVGQTTGGNRRGINGGAFMFLKLPTSGIVVDLPLIAGFPTTSQPDAGIEPDVPVVTTAEDLSLGRDPQMAAAIRLILQG